MVTLNIALSRGSGSDLDTLRRKDGRWNKERGGGKQNQLENNSFSCGNVEFFFLFLKFPTKMLQFFITKRNKLTVWLETICWLLASAENGNPG